MVNGIDSIQGSPPVAMPYDPAFMVIKSKQKSPPFLKQCSGAIWNMSGCVIGLAALAAVTITAVEGLRRLVKAIDENHDQPISGKVNQFITDVGNTVNTVLSDIKGSAENSKEERLAWVKERLGWGKDAKIPSDKEEKLNKVIHDNMALVDKEMKYPAFCSVTTSHDTISSEKLNNPKFALLFEPYKNPDISGDAHLSQFQNTLDSVGQYPFPGDSVFGWLPGSSFLERLFLQDSQRFHRTSEEVSENGWQKLNFLKEKVKNIDPVKISDDKETAWRLEYDDESVKPNVLYLRTAPADGSAAGIFAEQNGQYVRVKDASYQRYEDATSVLPATIMFARHQLGEAAFRKGRQEIADSYFQPVAEQEESENPPQEA